MKVCKVCGREYNGHTGYDMCQKHYRQYKKYGCCLDNNPRNKYDPNEIISYDNYAEIVLYDKSGNKIAKTKIDLDDINKVKKYKWCLDTSNGYVLNRKIGYLHRYLIGNIPNDMQIDHINKCRIDNRKSNLRICTNQENNFNKGLISSNTSGFTGVCWDKSRNKWIAQIKIGNKNQSARFDNLEDAIEYRKQKEIEYFREYRNKD